MIKISHQSNATTVYNTTGSNAEANVHGFCLAQPISVTNIQQQILSDDLLKQVPFMIKQLSLFRADAKKDKRQLNNLLPATLCLLPIASSLATTVKSN